MDWYDGHSGGVTPGPIPNPAVKSARVHVCTVLRKRTGTRARCQPLLHFNGRDDSLYKFLKTTHTASFIDWNNQTWSGNRGFLRLYELVDINYNVAFSTFRVGQQFFKTIAWMYSSFSDDSVPFRQPSERNISQSCVGSIVSKKNWTFPIIDGR